MATATARLRRAHIFDEAPTVEPALFVGGDDEAQFNPSAVRRCVRRIVRDELRREIFYGSNERREHRRVPLQRVIHVTALPMENGILCRQRTGNSFLAYTTDLSIHGIGFSHEEPLVTRQAIVTFDLMNQKPISLLVDVAWTRCLTDRSFRSGGKFLAVTKTPIFGCQYEDDTAAGQPGNAGGEA
jgi:hypothetical protein